MSSFVARFDALKAVAEGGEVSVDGLKFVGLFRWRPSTFVESLRGEDSFAMDTESCFASQEVEGRLVVMAPFPVSEAAVLELSTFLDAEDSFDLLTDSCLAFSLPKATRRSISRVAVKTSSE